MSLDQDIRDALARHEADVRAAPDAFDGVERKIRRAHQRRVAAAGTFVVALMVAAAASVVALRADREQGFAGPDDGPPEPTTSPTAAPFGPPNSAIFWDVTAGYQMWMPDTWRVTEYEGNIELLPEGEIGTTAGEDTFAVEIQLRLGEHYMDLVQRPGDSVEEETQVAGRPAYRVDYDGDDDPSSAERRGVIWTVDWPSGSCRLAGCSEDPNTLMIHILSSTSDRWEAYGDVAVNAVEALQRVGSPSDVARGPIRTRRGDIAGGVQADDRVQLLVQFLEARVRGGGAEQYLAPGVSTQGYGLYTFDDETNPYTEYTIESCEASGDASECRVRLRHLEQNDSTCCEFFERITVGPHQGKGLKILSIVEEGASPPGGP